MHSQHRYRGSAFGAAAVLETPFREILPTQASANLADFGGYGCGRSEDFRHRELIHFDLALSEVTGSQTHLDGDVTTYSTLVKSTIINLNVMGMIQCDKVVANLVSTYEDGNDAEPSIRLIGSRFQNLMIAGIPVKVCLNLDVLDDCPQHAQFKAKFKAKDECVRKLFGDEDLRKAHPKAPEPVKKYLKAPPDDKEKELPGDEYGVTTLSIVRKLEPECNAFKTYGHVIHIEGFGTIRLGEVRVGRYIRQLSMIQVELGCPVEGRAVFGSVDGGSSKGT
ncbi:MAG TPA: hypothetical protein VKB79_28515 [Bryobacteraceae bacterium]|nr:hypothetical protein [Bryobacteraceae bacterium]